MQLRLILLCTIIAITSISDIAYASEDWLTKQLQYRQKILDKLPNESLKKSPFQELYLKSMIKVEKDSFIIEIPFNLHGFDCGAPDCYVTTLRFAIDTSTLHRQSFPALSYTISTSGCGYTDATATSAYFHNNFQSTDTLVFVDTLYHNTLYILGADSNHIFAYFYENVDSQYKAMMPYTDIDLDNDAAIHPYMSTSLRSWEYELFVD